MKRYTRLEPMAPTTPPSARAEMLQFGENGNNHPLARTATITSGGGGDDEERGWQSLIGLLNQFGK